MRMRTFADFEKAHGRYVVCDFVCPTKETRENFEADLVIWMDTITEGRYEDTNKLFQNPFPFTVFYGAYAFNGDLSTWNVTAVTTMQSTFNSASVFNGDLSKWNVAAAKTLSQSTYNSTSFLSSLLIQ